MGVGEVKRYMLFYGDKCYPLGGINDFHGSFESVDEAIAAYCTWKASLDYTNKDGWAHVYDAYANRAVSVNFGKGWKTPGEGDMLR